MTAIQVIENPVLEGTRRALVLAEDAWGTTPNSESSSCGSFRSTRVDFRVLVMCERRRE